MFKKSPHYKKISQADSEDDEVLLYAAPLNQDAQLSDDQSFGTGIYNRDLRLNLNSPDHLQAKEKAMLRDRRHMIYSGLCCAALLVLLLGVALTVVVYAQVYLPQNLNTTSHTETPSEDPMCVKLPPPSPGGVNVCKGKNQSEDPTTKSLPSLPSKETEPVTPLSKTTSPTTLSRDTLAPFEETIPPRTTAGQSSFPTDPNSVPSEESVTTGRLTVESTEPSHQFAEDMLTETTTKNVDTTQSVKLDSATTHSQHTSRSVDWTRDVFPAATELSLQLFDMNRDGIQDVLTATVSDPCTCSLLALDGLTGITVWQKKVNFDVFSLRCILDANQDGVTDCIATGRFGGFISLSGVDGSIIWFVDSAITFPKYNFFFPLLVDDLDEDGVPDLINTHGGDPTYSPSEENRSPGSLVVVSGRTGGKLMDPVLMPDGGETYCSPVLFKMGDIDVVLFGSGGETLSGSLWGITLESIRTMVSKNKAELTQYKIETDDSFHPCFMDVESFRPTFNETFFDNKSPMSACPELSTHKLIPNMYDLCLYEIFRSTKKGILLPPLILDLNVDGIEDLLLTTFNGHVYAYDGMNMATLLWEAYNPGTESYSLPVPLFYNKDSYPDLIVRANLGEWDKGYKSSSFYLMDGRSGRTLWSLDSEHIAMNSGLSLAADTHGLDAMLFFSVGDKRARDRRHGDMQEPHDHETDMPLEPDNLWNSTPEDQFPDPDDDLEGFLHYCDHTMEELTVSVYLLTREMIEDGEVKPIMMERPFVFRGKIAANFSGDMKRHANIEFNYNTSMYPSGDGEAPEDFDPQYTVPPDVDPQNKNNGFPSNLNPQEMNGNSQFPPGFDPSKNLPSDFDPLQNPNQTDFDPSKFPPDFDPSKFPPDFDPSQADFDPSKFPPDFDPSQADFDPSKFPPGFDPSQADFDPSKFPPDFDPSKFPPGFDPSKFPPDFDPSQGRPPQPQDMNYDANNKKKFRCAHILVPTNDVATPTIGDVNGDGKLELSYIVGWETIPGSQEYLGGTTILKLRLRTFTIEDRFMEVFGKGKLDFSRFLPPDDQPWAKYMGKTGDSVYHPKHQLRKS